LRISQENPVSALEDEGYECQRRRMVAEQIAARGVRDRRVLEAMRCVPRHRFVTLEYRDAAYTDGPLPIGEGQTISQPYIVALMSEQLMLSGCETVLEVGTGSGYQAAILGCLAKQVHTIERHASLAERAKTVLAELGMQNICVHIGDGSQGLPEFAPYQGMLVTAAAPRVPRPLLAQLADGGRLVLPVGGLFGQTLECWRRRGDHYDRDQVLPVAFVPLRGRHGWEEDDWRRD
jgi:protein-L-isoaspartate(D-aspartate) O-methyltransferase